MTATRYRADIDGLRAVAVLLVVFDHLHTRLSGGYVGVDVFFVISGYLIGAHILAEVGAGHFSLVDFYERRVRRIFPALLVMLTVSTAAAWFLLLPTELLSFARSQLAALLSVSNFAFLRQASYFDTASALNPMLHTWSLAVEEQFYVALPLLALLVHRRHPHRLAVVLFTLTGVSFAAAAAVVLRAPSTAFFSSPLRAWELLLGTLLSQGLLLPPLRTALRRNAASVGGILLIVLPAALYTERTPFPGPAALPVCLGAALVIGAGQTGTSWVGSLLSWRPVVFVGAISYSLYLWHWPLIVFWNRGSLLPDDGVLTPHAKLGLFSASMAMATLSYYLVETPFRKGRQKPARRPLFAMTGALAALLIGVSMATLQLRGMPSRFPPDAVRAASFAAYNPTAAWRQSQCFLTPADAFARFSPETCLDAGAGTQRVLLLGDSMAAQLYPGLRSVFPGWSLSQANAADCRPFLTEPDTLRAEFAANCRALSQMIFRQYLPDHHFDTVLLAGSWHPEDLPELGNTILWLQRHGTQPILFGPVPEYDTPLPRVLAFALREGDPTLPERHLLPRAERLDREMEVLARTRWHVRYLSAFESLCGVIAERQATHCRVFAAPGVPLQFDTHHFTEAGSALYARILQQSGLLP